MKWWRVFTRGSEGGKNRRRQATRYDFDTPLTAKCSSWPKFVDLITGDISRTGLFVPTDELAEIGETVELQLSLPDGRTVPLTGSVVRVIDAEAAAKFGSKPGLGIQLGEPEGEARAVYQELLDRARSHEPRPSDDVVVAGKPEPAPVDDEDIPLDDDDFLELDDSVEDIIAEEGEELDIDEPLPPSVAPAVHTRASGIVIGIDLGTTFTSVAAAVNNRVTILDNDAGAKSTPSVISFLAAEEYVIGAEARERIPTDPGHTISSPKRLLGRSFHEDEVQRFITQAAYPTRPGPDGSVIIEMWGQPYAMPQLCSFLLKDARELAERRLGQRVDQAVVSVPVSFDPTRLDYLRRAANMAQLEIVAVVDEPSAAALANRYDPNFGGVVGVYDFGGGTFDFSVVDVSGGDFRVLATSGDTWLGGDDFDIILAEAASNQFWRKHQVDLRNQALEWQRLLFACERAKRALSTSPTALIHVPEVLRTASGMIDLRLSLNRETLERAVEPIVRQSIATCDEALRHLDLAAGELSAIYLSGGTTYMPSIRTSLIDHFQVPVRTGVPPEHAVCLGAAIHAAQIQFKSQRTLEER